MSKSNGLLWGIATMTAIALMAGCENDRPQPQNVTAVQIDSDDIGGVVSSSNGPEAGVWVIAESDDFDTRYAKIVVTDDRGRYVIPDLPSASYKVWVRG